MQLPAPPNVHLTNSISMYIYMTVAGLTESIHINRQVCVNLGLLVVLLQEFQIAFNQLLQMKYHEKLHRQYFITSPRALKVSGSTLTNFIH
jgi:hypothetical protein